MLVTPVVTSKIAGLPSPFLLDSFVEAAPAPIENHLPAIGGAWTYAGGVGGIVIDPSGQAKPTATGFSQPNNAAAPPSPDYHATMVVEFPLTCASRAGLRIRADGSGNNDYRLWANGALTGFVLSKLIGGVETVLATYLMTIINAGPLTIDLAAAGTTVTATINGVAQAPVTDVALAAAGRVGMVLQLFVAGAAPIATSIQAAA